MANTDAAAMVISPTTKEISTFVFFDLETIGLNTPGFKNKITELSMVAVHRSSLLFPSDKQSLPRVVNKLTVPVYPMRSIPYNVFQLTGLDNTLLYNQKDFDEDLGCLIKMFLQRLQPPICLVAHNGQGFDFPLLKTELTRVGIELPHSVLCADTLIAYRQYDFNELKTLQTSMHPGTKTPEHKSVCSDGNGKTPLLKRKSDADCPLTEKVKKPSDTRRQLFPSVFDENQSAVGQSKSLPMNNEDGSDDGKPYWDDLHEIMGEEFSAQPPGGTVYPSSDDASATPPLLSLNGGGDTNSGVPPSNTFSNPPIVINTAKQSGTNGGHSAAGFSSTTMNQNQIRSESLLKSNPKRQFKKLPSYKLDNIHQYVVGYTPTNSHSAESDCLAMIRIVQRTASWFCKWAEENSTPFNDSRVLYHEDCPKMLPRGVFPSDP